MKNLQSTTYNLQLKVKAALSLVVGGWSLVVPFSALASSHLSNQPGIDFTIQDILGIITGLACWFTRVALVLIVVFVIFYGLKFMFAQGDPTKLGEAKKSFLWGLVGVMVILGTYTIIATVANGLGADYTLFLPLRC